MEDAVVIEREFIVSDAKKTFRLNFSLFAVYDGHGGAMCSTFLAEHTADVLIRHLSATRGANVGKSLADAIAELDESCLKSAEDGSGSTGVILLIDRDRSELWVANIGDSRCVLLSSGGVTQLSIEHKPSEPTERARIEAATGWVAFGRVMGILAVSRSFGDRDFKSHSAELIISTPSITHRRLTARDEHIILACDGLWDVFSNDEIYRFVQIANEAFPDLTLDQLATDIVTDAIQNRHSRDNVSAILLKTYVSESPKFHTKSSDLDATLESEDSEPKLTLVSDYVLKGKPASDKSDAVASAAGDSTKESSATSSTDARKASDTRAEKSTLSGGGGGSTSSSETEGATDALAGLDIAPSAIGGVVRGGGRGRGAGRGSRPSDEFVE
jgi:protein phosphatase 2C family protein 2/3